MQRSYSRVNGTCIEYLLTITFSKINLEVIIQHFIVADQMYADPNSERIAAQDGRNIQSQDCV